VDIIAFLKEYAITTVIVIIAHTFELSVVTDYSNNLILVDNEIDYRIKIQSANE
jgi:hypothetical protein